MGFTHSLCYLYKEGLVALRPASCCCPDVWWDSGFKHTKAPRRHTPGLTALPQAHCQHEHTLSKHLLDERTEEGWMVPRSRLLASISEQLKS